MSFEVIMPLLRPIKHLLEAGWVQNSNGKPNDWATNLPPSNPKLHNELIQHRGSSLEGKKA
jgi:hypothetical protein